MKRMKLDLKKVTELIQTEKDSEKLSRDLKAMIEEAYPLEPLRAFKEAEYISMREFSARFKEIYCGGIESIYNEWPVIIRVDENGDIAICPCRKSKGEEA